MPRRRGKKNNRQKRKRSAYEKWRRHLAKHFGAYEIHHGKAAQRGLILAIATGSRLPPRMPAPGGPAPGAAFTTVQYCNSFNTSTNVSNALINQTGATPVYGVIAFRLDDFSQASTFSSMFDQYRIEEVHLRFRSRNSNVQMFAIASPNQAVPQLQVAIDRDDSTAWSSTDTPKEYDNMVQVSGFDSVDVILEPSITPSVFAAGAFSGYGVAGSRDYWLDMANTDVPHYGVKFMITALQATTTSNWGWDVEAWVKASFRNTR